MSESGGSAPGWMSGSVRFPPELGNLAYPANLDFSYNNLTGPIPTEVGNLDNLTELPLSGNDLTEPDPRGARQPRQSDRPAPR